MGWKYGMMGETEAGEEVRMGPALAVEVLPAFRATECI